MVRSRESKILARTFKDKLTAYRKIPVRDAVTQATVEKESQIYENVSCALSSSSNSVPDRQEFHSTTQRESVIFTMPDIELLDNDRVVIVTEAGQVVEGSTGKTFRYISHGETPFTEERLT